MQRPFPDEYLVFGRPAIGEAEIAEVVDSLRSGWIGTGPKVARFERDFAAYKEVPRAMAVSSCTAALHLAMLAAKIGPGDEVITTPLTFCATINAIIHAGATPVLADVNPVTMNLDPAAASARLTPATRGLVPVHFAGRPCAMDALLTVARHRDLAVIEDCAHAIETELAGRKAGTIGDFGCFSFYATKNVCTAEGGMVLARDAGAAARIKTLALHGLSADAWERFGDRGHRHYYAVEPGFKSNMTDIQAALGIHQLARVEASWRRRRAVWAHYQQTLADTPVTRPAEPAQGERHAFHLYTILVDRVVAGIDRDELLDRMHERGVGAGVHYLSVAEHPCYQHRYGWRPEDWPNAMGIGRRTVSLPMSPSLTERDVERVVAAVTGAVEDAACRRRPRAAA